MSAVSGHLLHCVRSLWSFPVPMSAVSGHPPVLCPQSLVISCTVSASLVIPCTVSAVSGHPLYCPQSLVIPCTVSAV
ncbi:unnamed protein product, partial [Staurois parvus]